MKPRSFPHALTILFAIMVLAGAACYIIPKGEYQRTVDAGTQREAVVPNSYQSIDGKYLSPFQIITCIPRGFANGVEVVILILMVGGCFFIIDKTGALQAGVSWLAGKLKGKESLALIGLGIFFLIGGATEGLEEEIIPLLPVLIMLVRSFGFQAVVAIGVSFGAATIGAAYSPLNPFGSVLAQKIAGLPFLSGGMFLLLVMLFQFALWMLLLIAYAKKTRIEIEPNKTTTVLHPIVSARHIVILVLAGMGFILLAIGMTLWGWGLNEISAEFFVIAIVVGLVGGLGFNETFKLYSDGFKEVIFAAMIVGLSYSIPQILKEGQVLDSIIYGLFLPAQYVHTTISAFGMMIGQSLLHFFVPGYAGQAALTIPILAPLSDLIGLSRTVCTMAFQFGAIITNLISPTNGALMALVAVSGISFGDWFLFIRKKFLIMLVSGGAWLWLAIWMGI